MRTYWAVVVPKTTTPEESHIMGFGEMPTLFVEQVEAEGFATPEGFEAIPVYITPKATLDKLVEAVEPFARFYTVLSAMGGNTPKSGTYISVVSSAGEAEATIEDFQKAFDALAAFREGGE